MPPNLLPKGNPFFPRKGAAPITQGCGLPTRCLSARGSEVFFARSVLRGSHYARSLDKAFFGVLLFVIAFVHSLYRINFAKSSVYAHFFIFYAGEMGKDTLGFRARRVPQGRGGRGNLGMRG